MNLQGLQSWTAPIALLLPFSYRSQLNSDTLSRRYQIILEIATLEYRPHVLTVRCHRESTTDRSFL
jgi:hypothetical protein